MDAMFLRVIALASFQAFIEKSITYSWESFASFCNFKSRSNEKSPVDKNITIFW